MLNFKLHRDDFINSTTNPSGSYKVHIIIFLYSIGQWPSQKAGLAGNTWTKRLIYSNRTVKCSIKAFRRFSIDF